MEGLNGANLIEVINKGSFNLNGRNELRTKKNTSLITIYHFSDSCFLTLDIP